MYMHADTYTPGSLPASLPNTPKSLIPDVVPNLKKKNASH